MLARLTGKEGVVQLAPQAQGAEGLALHDVGGKSLAQVLLAGRCDVQTVLSLAIPLARTLAEVHHAGIIHRDLSPANIVLSATGHPVLIDFDLAVLAADLVAVDPNGQMAGTMSYMAPEQTGRTGRGVDQRADLYSLGAILYELATGRPPFQQADALQLIYDHLVREPVPPHKVDARVSLGLSSIIVRLLAKAPERRYQSAQGLLHDLQRLRGELDQGRSGVFELGERDFPARLAPPAQLIGREIEKAMLRSAFADAMHTARRTVLVEGAAGVGKSALINELRPVVAEAGGWFLYGKFDQYQRDGSAVGALMQALGALGRLLLTQSGDEVAAQRQRILHRLGRNAGLVTRASPEFALLLGVQADVPEIDPRQAELQLQQTMMDLLAAIASPAFPLVLVVDDLQWAGALSLRVFERMMLDRELRGLLVVGSYRSEEVDAHHALLPMLARWQQLVQPPRQIALAILTLGGICEMTRDMLRLDPEPARELAQSLNVLTAGNPFDTVEMINALRGDGVLRLGESGWQWDDAKVRSYVGRGNVVDLLAARINRLPTTSRELLEFMSCLGSALECKLLCAATGLGDDELRARLRAPLDDGLVVADLSGGQDSVGFRHDRVQQAMLGAMDELQRGRCQLEMARRLATVPAFEGDAAEQYLACRGMLAEPGEQRRAAHLFHGLAQALAGTATYLLAERYLAAADGLLVAIDSPVDAALRHAIEVERHRALYSLGRVDEAGHLYAKIHERAQDPLDLVDATNLQSRLLDMTGRVQESLALSVRLLAQLGLNVPPNFSDPFVEQKINSLTEWIRQGQRDHSKRAQTRDLRLLGIAKLLARMGGAAYLSKDRNAHRWVLLESHRLWVENGPLEDLIGCVSNLGIILVNERQDYRTGYEISRHVLGVGDELGFKGRTSAARFMFSWRQCPWIEPLENALEHANRAVEDFQVEGEASFACLFNVAKYVLLLEIAPTLQICDAQVEAGLVPCLRTGNIHATALHTCELQFLRALRGQTRAPNDFDDESFNEQAFMQKMGHLPNIPFLFDYYRALQSLIWGDATGLSRYAPIAMSYFVGVEECHYRAVHGYLFVALSRAWQMQEGVACTAPQIAELESCRGWLASRAADQPYNFLHLLRLVEAEQAWALGDMWKAAAAFDAAVVEAGAKQRPWHRALIAERAGVFYIARGMTGVGRNLLVQARDHYQGWGATAKVDQLQRRHAFLQAPAPSLSAQVDGNPGSSIKSSASVSPDALDLVGVLRASQALSSETSLERLTARVSEVLASLSGATKVLVLSCSEDQWWLLSQAPEVPSMPVAQAAEQGLLPLSAFAYAQRTGEALMVDDAAGDDRFARDRYFASVPVCSLLMVPITSQGSARGMLLLENRLGRAAFNAQRLDAVMLIAGQLAVSLANAQLYKGPAVNHNATNPRVPLVVRPEIPTMLEAGLKNMFLGGRLGVNVSAYAMNIKDYQATVWDPAAVAFIFTNAPKLSNRGATINFYGKPTHSLTVNGGLAYMVAKLGPGFLVECAMGSPAGCTRDAAGDQAGGTPKVRGTLALDYRFALASMTATLGGDVVYTAERVFDRTDPARNLPATTIVGARFGIRSADDKVGLTFYARNLFDKFSPSYRSGNLAAFATGDNRSYIQFLGPESRRVLGVSLDARF